jgi:hypothetical protein
MNFSWAAKLPVTHVGAHLVKMLNTFLTKVEEMLAGDGEKVKNRGSQTSEKFLSLMDRNWGNFSASGSQLLEVAVYRHSL